MNGEYNFVLSDLLLMTKKCLDSLLEDDKLLMITLVDSPLYYTSFKYMKYELLKMICY